MRGSRAPWQRVRAGAGPASPAGPVLAPRRPPGLCHPAGISVFPSAGLEEKTIIRSLGRRQRGCGTGQWRPDGQGKGLGGRWGKRGPAVRLVPCLPSLPAVPTLHSRAPFIPHAFMGASGAPASVPGWLGTPAVQGDQKGRGQREGQRPAGCPGALGHGILETRLVPKLGSL